MREDPGVLIIGGTAEARGLAAVLVQTGIPVLSSLAGRVRDPALPAGEVRIGGFGGPDGLREFLRQRRFRALVDATHPFATRMSAHVAAVAPELPTLRLARPGWADHPDAAGWTWVDGPASAVQAIRATDGPLLLTTGRQTLDHYRVLTDRTVLVRVVEPPEQPLPSGWSLIRDRGPYRVEAETSLLRDHGIRVLVSKDSGGSYTAPKLDAARDLGIRVVMLTRPAAPATVLSTDSVDGALAWLWTVLH
ncbi:cobalt-precorrin-6A reductase [Nakamurella sp. YIM 132087]|uniref:Cobalt-precorrin-6A reductase n=1 Tax=Nakamurella alba TaxID=2665158 RepID=A0A7K1FG89_9ACTN|nr:cobalt-precorrin-6A reductase [Nakamurella alba]MTD13076.1 cobalt-precorrin-6A reductase [Nakamurella alba]